MDKVKPIRNLKWDSDFWGLDFYEYNLEMTYDFESLKKPYIVQVKIPVGSNSLITLDELGFECVERKVNLIKDSMHRNEHIDKNIHPLKVEDLNGLESEIGSLFVKHSRYRFLNLQKVEYFYTHWLINSCNASMDTHAYGYFIQNQLAGFVTFRLEDDRLIIGLFGVLVNNQGKGIGSSLLRFVESKACDLGLKAILVSTQKTNLNAINVYQKNGYEIESEELWFYKMNLENGEKV